MSTATRVWPSRDDYQNAVLHPKRNLKDPRLHAAQVETNLRMGALKLPSPRSGNFGAVYKFTNQREAYALKVFDKAQPDRHLRYRLIDEHLHRSPKSPHLVSFDYDEGGIQINGRWYPTLLMEWAEGQLLDHYLDETLTRRGRLDNGALCSAWVLLVQNLGQQRIAHGDLQHGNILVMPDGFLKLVDYDGMFVPAMRQHDLTAAEIGLPAYQHPKRDRGYFDERLDHFAALVILLSLACLDRGLWRRYHTDDNCLVVREPDLRRPRQSALFTELAQSPDAPVRRLAQFLGAAAQGGLDAVPVFARVVEDNAVRQLLSSSWRPTYRPDQEQIRAEVAPPKVVPPKVTPAREDASKNIPAKDIPTREETAPSADSEGRASKVFGILVVAAMIVFFGIMGIGFIGAIINTIRELME
ncbi:MAG: protein kinase family protein [Acidobacteria bacterium]|nr:MAG: protein kinase family protein [Acidobacteriota bacterium]